MKDNSDHGFRLRGEKTTRLETFLDAAFAFATTMLIISVGDIPNTYGELVTALKGVPAFAASFAAVLSFWMAHRKWSRRYGMEDFVSILISMAMVFILLVYIYPLKLVFSALFAWISGGWLPSEFKLSDRSELISLFIIYGIGFAAMGATMSLLYYRALKANLDPALNEAERVMTRYESAAFLVLTLTGVFSALFAATMPDRIAMFAGFAYITLPISMSATAIVYDRKRVAVEAESK